MAAILFSSWGGEIIDNRGQDDANGQSPAKISLPEQFNQDEKIQALMGWYGIILRSRDVNIVDLSRSYMKAVSNSSCGKCTPCRIGTGMLSDILERICKGGGTPNDLDSLLQLSHFVKNASKCQVGKSGPVPLLHALEHFRDDFENSIEKDTPVKNATYYSRLTAPCIDACPIHLDIPTYIENIREARFQDSLDVIRQRLPIPGVLGRTCVRPCEENCRRALIDEPISIKYLKRFVADRELAHQQAPNYKIEPSKKTGKVAIIGGGPAGVTCAYHLARKGHQVTIYEQLDELGGMAAMGIPDYRLPRDILNSEIEQIQKMGVTIRRNVSIGKEIKLTQLEEDNNAVFIAVGAQGNASMRLQDEDKGYKGYISGIKFLREINEGRDPYPDGKKVVVVGGGNVAIDCARSAFRVGKKDVTLVYRRTRKEMPADEVEIHDAKEEKVKFQFLTSPVRIIADDSGRVTGLECIRMELVEPDASGRRRPIPANGSEHIIPCDIAVPAIGQVVDLTLLEGVDDVKTTRWKTVIVDEVTKQTNRPKLFSAGDCETGPDALITACAGGRKAAISIDRVINAKPLNWGQGDYFDKLFDKINLYDPKESLPALSRQTRKQLNLLPPKSRKSSFAEIEEGFSTPEAIAEASRCLRCYSVATVAV